MLKSKEKIMQLKVKKKAPVEVLSCYSARQLQFAIRLGILPTPDKLNGIFNKRTNPENAIK
jgi:hypothetical protein